jgi:hypothetical protein
VGGGRWAVGKSSVEPDFSPSGLELSLDDRPQHARPDRIPPLVHVQLVFHEQLGTRLARRSQHFTPDVHKGQPRVRLRVGLDPRVQIEPGVLQMPPRRIGCVRDVDQARPRQRGVDLLDERREVVHDVRYRSTGDDVVAAAVEDDQARAIRDHDPVRERGDLADVRAAEPPVEHRQTREVGRHGFPEADARTAGKNDAAGGGPRSPIGLVEGANLRFPLREVQGRGSRRCRLS